MQNQSFYTLIDEDGKFLNSNFMCDNTNNILNAIRFRTLKDVKNYLRFFKKDMPFKIIKVDCSFSEINS